MKDLKHDDYEISPFMICSEAQLSARKVRNGDEINLEVSVHTINEKSAFSMALGWHRWEEAKRIRRESLYLNAVKKIVHLSADNEADVKTALFQISEIGEALKLKEDEEEETPYIFTDESKAREILTKGDPLTLILENVQKIHKGDDEIIQACALTPLSLFTDSTLLHEMVIGRSGKGKGVLAKMLNCFPPYFYEFWGSLSPQFLKYYFEKPNPARLHVIEEGKIVGEGLGFLRSLTSRREYGDGIRAKYGSVKDLEPVVIDPPFDILLWISCVSPMEDEDNQILNRFLIPNVNESPEQDVIVHEFQKRAGGLGLKQETPEEFKIIRDIYHILLSEKPVHVVIPFYSYIQFKPYENRRNYPLFEALLKASAFMHRHQRHAAKRKTEEEVIFADRKDFEIAQRIWEAFYATQELKVNKSTEKVYNKVPVSYDERSTRSDLTKETRKPYNTVKDALDKLIAQGLVNCEKENNKWVYWRSEKELTDLRNPTVFLIITETDVKRLQEEILRDLRQIGEGIGENLPEDYFLSLSQTAVIAVSKAKHESCEPKKPMKSNPQASVSSVSPVITHSNTEVLRFLKTKQTIREEDFAPFDWKKPSAWKAEFESKGYIDLTGRVQQDKIPAEVEE